MDENEAISAVVDDGFLGEEAEDEDYEDLYNDVNVGENFLNSMRPQTEPPPPPPPVPPTISQTPPDVSFQPNHNNNNNTDNNVLGGVTKELKIEFSSRVENNNNVPNNQPIVQKVHPPLPPPPLRVENTNVYINNGGSTTLFVGDLHWWTTDAELESELCKYGQVKEVKFFDERASGKSKGYCQVDFYDPMAASACVERMNGHVFNGRPCAVAFASPLTVKRMGEAQFNKTQQQIGQGTVNQPRKDFPNKPVVGNIGVGGGNNNNQGGFENNGRGGFGRGNWGRGSRGGGMGGRGGRGFSGNGYGQGPPFMHPQNMMGQGFDPAFGGPMGRMGGYGVFPGAPNAPFPGMGPPFGPGMGNVGGMPGVAPHVNPAFFGRGMPMNSMGMMHGPGLEGPNMGMWPDPNMGGWVGDEHGGRDREGSYGEEAASDHNYGEGGQDKRQLPDAVMEKDGESGSSERKYRDERGVGYDRDPPRENDMGRDHDWSEKKHRGDRDGGRERERDRGRSRDRDRERYRDDGDRYNEHRRHRSREGDYDEERDRGRSARAHGKSRLPHEEDHRSRSRDADYGKRRRITSD